MRHKSERRPADGVLRSHVLCYESRDGMLKYVYDVGAGRRSEVERSVMGRRIEPSWAISRSSQCSTTGVTKAVVCVILSV